MTPEAQAIFQAITEKGWAFYFRGPSDAKIPHDETYRRGAVDSLERGILYILLPRVEDSTDEAAIKRIIEKHQPLPRITVPSGFSYYGRIIYQFGQDAAKTLQHLRGTAKDEFKDILIPGQEIPFIGIELQDGEVRILSPSKCYMPYEVFLAALHTLADISGLT